MTTPVLLITFNRPNHTRQVLESIRQAKPTQLFVFQDGARDGNAADIEKCAAVRHVVQKMVDWDCELHTNYSEVNLGCGPGPAAAITWFFDNVEQGIIMEDDCLPHADFYPYCEEMLNRYKNSKVMFVGATIYNSQWICDASYAFSHYLFVGAWASWRRAWQGYDIDLHSVNVQHFKRMCRKVFYSYEEIHWWKHKLIEIQRDTAKKSYWDYQMQIHILLRGGLVIHPQRNMISNIGFDAEGTHTTNNADGRGELPVYSCLPLVHPTSMDVNKQRDYQYFAKTHAASFPKNIIHYLYDYMRDSKGVLHNMLLIYKQIKHA